MTDEMARTLAVIGRHRRSTIDQIAKVLELPRRAIEEAIEDLRLAGHPVCADGSGVYLATNADQLTAYVEARRRRLVSIYLGNRRLRQTARRMAAREQGQTELSLWGQAS